MMNRNDGKDCKKSPEKRKEIRLGIAVGVALILLALVALLWVGSNEAGDVHSGNVEPLEQRTEPQATKGENGENNPQDGIGETRLQEDVCENISQNDRTEPSKESVAVVDAYLKEINGELHLFKLLDDGTEIDEGPIDDGSENNPSATYTVTFMNYDGTILKAETIKSGGNATPPASPTRDGYTFIGWSGSYSNVNTDITVVAQYWENTTETMYYVVRFVDHDGAVLKTQAVENGQAAKAPVDPTRVGYSFIGWDNTFDNVTADLTVTARYEEISSTDLTISVENKTVSAGETVSVAVSLKNNPGIVGMTLKLTYDERAMTLTAIDKGSALDEMTFTTPKDLRSGCKLPWDAELVTPEDATEGEIVILTFKVSDTAATANYSVSLSAVGDIIDNDLMSVVTILRNGTITIK